jgi:hypothetical protein
MAYRALAQRFGDCIASNDFAAACALLGKELQASVTPEVVENAVVAMTAYAPGPIRSSESDGRVHLGGLARQAGR